MECGGVATGVLEVEGVCNSMVVRKKGFPRSEYYKMNRLQVALNRLNPLALIPTTDCRSFKVCQSHMPLFRDIDTTFDSNAQCDACHNRALRAASWKESVVLTLVHGITIPIGAPICSSCYKISAEGIEELLRFFEAEHR